MNLLALILGWLQVAPEIAADIVSVVHHARTPANVTQAQAVVKSGTATK